MACVGTVRAEDPDKLPVPNGNYVSDFAGVIDADSKQQMEALSREVYEKAHATIVVVTVNSLGGDTIEGFTTKLEDRWKVGPKGTDRGLLMIVAIQDRKRRIEVGSGLEGILNDAKVGDIGRTMVPQLQQGAYGAALLGGERQIAQVIADDAHVALNTTITTPVQHTYHYETVHRRRSNGWIGLVVFLVILFLMSRGGRYGGGGGGWLWFLLGSMMGGGGRDNDRWGGGGFGGGGFGGGGGGDGGGGDFGGGFGGGSGGGGASGDF